MNRQRVAAWLFKGHVYYRAVCRDTGLHPLLFSLLYPSSPSIIFFPLPVSPFVISLFQPLVLARCCLPAYSSPSHEPAPLPPSPILSPSISLHQLQRAVSVADLEGTCLLRWNKIIRPLVPLCVQLVQTPLKCTEAAGQQRCSKQAKLINKQVKLGRRVTSASGFIL